MLLLSEFTCDDVVEFYMFENVIPQHHRQQRKTNHDRIIV